MNILYFALKWCVICMIFCDLHDLTWQKWQFSSISEWPKCITGTDFSASNHQGGFHCGLIIPIRMGCQKGNLKLLLWGKTEQAIWYCNALWNSNRYDVKRTHFPYKSIRLCVRICGFWDFISKKICSHICTFSNCILLTWNWMICGRGAGGKG